MASAYRLIKGKGRKFSEVRVFSFTGCHNTEFKTTSFETNDEMDIEVEPFRALNTLPLPRM
jgi:hypothetical protein